MLKCIQLKQQTWKKSKKNSSSSIFYGHSLLKVCQLKKANFALYIPNQRSSRSSQFFSGQVNTCLPSTTLSIPVNALTLTFILHWYILGVHTGKLDLHQTLIVSCLIIHPWYRHLNHLGGSKQFVTWNLRGKLWPAVEDSTGRNTCIFNFHKCWFNFNNVRINEHFLRWHVF